MPYITPDRKTAIIMCGEDPANAGELNFIVTEACIDYLKIRGISYTNLNEVIGVLECAKLEFYRRLAAPYESIKMAQNGDVYLP
jgi:hypothetical protein